MSRLGTLGNKLYTGESAYNIVPRRKTFYAVSAVIILIAIGALLFKGLTLGVEFKGGAVFTVKTTTGSVEQARSTVGGTGIQGAIVTKLNNDRIRVTTPPISTDQSATVREALATKFGTTPDQIDVQLVGPSWGDQITKKALTGLVLFLILVALFLSLYFEWKMALAALIALIHDLIITIGIYALVGFEVTPATVIGVLTILGYSLYDTVVVFDKVRENTAGLAGGSRMTYAQAANLAVNQTLVRSINTSVVALLPIASILFVGAGLLGAGTLEDLALALFIGIASGAYSSIFIATPVLVDLKEREPAMQALARRVEARQGGTAAKAKAKAGATAGAAAGAVLVDEGDEVADDADTDETDDAAESAAGESTSDTAAARPTGGPRPQPKRPTSKAKKSRKKR